MIFWSRHLSVYLFMIGKISILLARLIEFYKISKKSRIFILSWTLRFKISHRVQRVVFFRTGLFLSLNIIEVFFTVRIIFPIKTKKNRQTIKMKWICWRIMKEFLSFEKKNVSKVMGGNRISRFIKIDLLENNL